MATYLFDDQAKLIDWLTENVTGPSVYDSLKNWVLQHLRESIVKYPDYDPKVSYNFSPGEITTTEFDTARGYELEMVLSYDKKLVEKFTCYLLTDENNKINHFLYFEECAEMKKDPLAG